eukprot:6467885-Alexandrium_andersonii.AAC.1
MPQAVLACQRFGSAGGLRNQLDRFNSLLGSIGTRCMCHRVSSWIRTFRAAGLLGPPPMWN